MFSYEYKLNAFFTQAELKSNAADMSRAHILTTNHTLRSFSMDRIFNRCYPQTT